MILGDRLRPTGEKCETTAAHTLRRLRGTGDPHNRALSSYATR